MTCVLHVFDGECGWEQRTTAMQLAARLPHDRFKTEFACCGRVSFDQWEKQYGIAVHVLSFGSAPAALVAPKLKRYAESLDARILHTWGMPGLAAAAAIADEHTILHSVFDPGISDKHVKLLRTLGDRSRFAVICAAERVRRRLVERGVAFERCVVVRPAVDFAEIGKVDGGQLRQKLGVPGEARLLIIPPPRTWGDGHLAAAWAVLMRRYLDESLCLLVPGRGSEIERLRGYAGAFDRAGTVIYVEDRIPFEALCVACDDLIIGDISEIPMTAAAWAMAGNTLITAPATYATSELLANDLNARLFKGPENWRHRATKIAALLDLYEQSGRVREVARGQAYDVFSLRRCARQHEQVIDNLLTGKPPAEDISDPALVGAAG